jgi:2-oxoglutarate dehydrogenase E1 component
MNRSTVASRWNLDLIEEYHQRWLQQADSVPESWRHFFEGYELAQSHAPGAIPARQSATPIAGPPGDGLERLIEAYRGFGHLLADLDPLDIHVPPRSSPWLDPVRFGLNPADTTTRFHTSLLPSGSGTLAEVIERLQRIYCGRIGYEFMHIADLEIRRWFEERFESPTGPAKADLPKKRRILWKLHAAQLFEQFLHEHYVGQKRFSLEGGEALIPLLDAIIEHAGRAGVREIVMGMPHRGRLNVLANILDKPYALIFSEFEGNMPTTVAGDGDVKYHLGFSADRTTSAGQTIHLSLTPNPSHLEAVNPVVEGRVRAKQRRFGDTERKLGIPILIHGDAAFAGQGLVAETLNLSQLEGYRTGGTIHIVVNNQIGFTTVPADARSTRYCTDVAKMIDAPIFHVHGEDPEAVVAVGELALDFRQKFGRDVVIDLVCFRRHGHNEGDEPVFTQPLMYAKIKDRPTVTELYTEQLIMMGELTVDEADTIRETFSDKMQQIYDEVHHHQDSHRNAPGFSSHWSGLSSHHTFEPVETGVPAETLKRIARGAFATLPSEFKRNPKLDRILGGWAKTIETGGHVEWPAAEALAFGSLLVEGTPVRLSGQDCRRGTFSQRHMVLADAETGIRYTPLNHIEEGQAQLCIYDSMLSEAAVLGFDYGYSLDEPHMLILWEAQFGDFSNGAQVLIDQFISSAESKWGRASGLVMLLPHGYEGQGPEHSSARLERFLQLCGDENIQVVNATTSAQYFHLLRRQVRRSFRKPLVVMTPKSILRHPDVASPLADFTHGQFREVLDDPTADPQRVSRVVLCSGKVYYDLLKQRQVAGKTQEVALIRLEQFYPWPADLLRQTISRYRSATDWVWAQEESQNMGGWSFVDPRLRALFPKAPFQYVGRDASASPATGSKLVHDREQAELVQAAIGAAVPHLVTATPVGSRS